MKRALWAISIIFSLIIGVLLGKTIQRWPIIKVKTEVDTIGAIISLFSMIVTLGAAYWVASILESKKEANRVEKDLIIKRIDSIHTLIEDTSNKVSIQEIDYLVAVSSIKRMSLNVNAIIDAVKGTDITIDASHHVNIISSLGDLKKLLTDTPRIQDEHLANLPIEVREGIIHIATDRRLQIDTEFDNIKSLIFNLELAINKG